MRNKIDKSLRNLILFWCCWVVGVIVLWIFVSSQESKAFNKLTGSDTTTADAMFVQLRVVEPIRKVGK